MFNTSKIALSLALVIATASGAMAAGKHPVRGHGPAVARQVPAAALQSFGSAAGAGTAQQPLYFKIQSYAP
jgi:hypothetical protein